MSRSATVLARVVSVTGRIAILALAATAAVQAQSAVSAWDPIGNSLVDFSLAGLAGGPVDRVWYSPDGGTLYATTFSGKCGGVQSTAVGRVPNPVDRSAGEPGEGEVHQGIANGIPRRNSRLRLDGGRRRQREDCDPAGD